MASRWRVLDLARKADRRAHKPKVGQFSIEGTVIAVAACAIIAYPSLWIARKYIPN